MSQRRTVRQALQHVADYPTPVDDNVLTMHTGELVARTLFDIANMPDARERGSMARANKARAMIMDRLEGRRRAGTMVKESTGPVVLSMHDLTGGALDEQD